MTDKFILLTTTDNNPVIIGLSNISSIELPDHDKEKNRNGNYSQFCEK